MQRVDVVKLVAYVRVSSVDASEQEPSATEQERVIQQWAQTSGHAVIDTYRDVGVSGANGIEGRVALPLALDALPEADGIVVVRLDRLARDLMVQEVVLARVWGMEKRLWTTDQGEVMADDPSDPYRTAMRQMTGVFSQLERSMASLRMHGGRRRKAARHGYVGGPQRYGQAVADKDYQSDAGEQAVITLMRQLRGRGLSWREVAAALDARGVPAQRGGAWHANTARRILARST